jgi:hypothetical protein
VSQAPSWPIPNRDQIPVSANMSANRDLIPLFPFPLFAGGN